MPDREAEAFLQEMGAKPLFIAGAWIQLAIADQTTDHLIGDVGLFIDADRTLARIGFTLETAAQGRGIATAAVREAIQLLYDFTEIRDIMAITDDRNTGSIRLLERAGFRRDSTHDTTFRGEPCVEHVYVLHADA